MVDTVNVCACCRYISSTAVHSGRHTSRGQDRQEGGRSTQEEFFFLFFFLFFSSAMPALICLQYYRPFCDARRIFSTDSSSISGRAFDRPHPSSLVPHPSSVSFIHDELVLFAEYYTNSTALIVRRKQEKPPSSHRTPNTRPRGQGVPGLPTGPHAGG